MTKKTNEPSGWNPVFEFPLDDRNTIIIDGVKYQRVVETQSFYDKLWGLLKTKLGDSVECDEMTDRVRDLIRENIPEYKKGVGLPEYFVGYNDAIRRVNENLFK
jgi:hypothetical protein